ncbi:mercuric transporter MerT family protein [uncultured Cycloclasticus sp.]|uniref:mercuric transporter MerT family protein n=1 Tax=uncultured Cycloclasticus sp. TaxID=172194 RepID=UPI0025910E25|nr:mercuric transporter MerT family protein [uncultured Cycloclasticus sp.]
MGEIEMKNEREQSRSKWLAAAGISGALIASSCCVLPLLLVTLGISGAWIGNLTALEPYKPYFLSVTVLLLGFGFWYVYYKPKKKCEEGDYCARPSSTRITKSALWIATVLVLLSASVNYWAPLFY